MKPRYRPGEIAKIKKEHRDKKHKNAKVGGDHVDVEVRRGWGKGNKLLLQSESARS